MPPAGPYPAQREKCAASAIKAILIGSASDQDLGPPGFDFDSGYGLVNGRTAVGAVSPGSSCKRASGTLDCPSDLILGDKPNEPATPGTINVKVRR